MTAKAKGEARFAAIELAIQLGHDLSKQAATLPHVKRCTAESARLPVCDAQPFAAASLKLRHGLALLAGCY